MTEYGFHHLPVIEDERPVGTLACARRRIRHVVIRDAWAATARRISPTPIVRSTGSSRKASASRGRPGRIPRQRTAMSRRGLRESASTAAAAPSPSKKKTTSRSLTKTWCRSSPKPSTSKGCLPPRVAGRPGGAALNRHNDGHARPRRPLGPEPRQQVGDFAEGGRPR